MRGDGGLDWGGSHGDTESWLDSGSLLILEPMMTL